MLLVCNAADAVAELLEHWRPAPEPRRSDRVGRLLPGSAAPQGIALQSDAAYRAAARVVASLAA
jgi:hypothetical protein